jgi:adenine-specific DNA-methyltransferase
MSSCATSSCSNRLKSDPDADAVHFHPERLYPDIDLAETLSHLRGKWIKRITEDYVEFEDGERMSLTDPDWETLKPMVWWIKLSASLVNLKMN